MRRGYETSRQWSGEYNFRRSCGFVEDVFEPTGVNSLVGAFYELCTTKWKMVLSSAPPNWPLALREDVHMAVTGTYLAQLAGGFVFYVLRPEEGQAVVPNRDVIQFPVAIARG